MVTTVRLGPDDLRRLEALREALVGTDPQARPVSTAEVVRYALWVATQGLETAGAEKEGR